MWIQRAVAERWKSLEVPILQSVHDAKEIFWLSPLREDEFAEYSDEAFLTLLSLEELVTPLKEFWPRRGPQWDALARFDNDDILLVEAKAHIGEFCTPPSGASPDSLGRIRNALFWTATELGVEADVAASWHSVFYQYTNRLAHLAFLRSRGINAWLAMVGFTGVKGFPGRTTEEAWEAAIRVAHYALGLPFRHALSRYVIFVHPSVKGRT